MARQFTTSEGYVAFYGRVESAFTPEDMTTENLSEWLRNDALADQFAITREVAIQIREAETIEQLKELQKEAKQLTIHKNTLLKRINEKVEEIRISIRERLVAESFVRLESFAEEKGIKLSDKVLGREETWKDGNQYLVIRKNGSFKAWRKIK